MENDPQTQTQQDALNKLKALRETLGQIDLGQLQSYPHLLEMLKIQDPVQRLEYLNEHRDELERDKAFLTGLIQQAGLSPEDLKDPTPEK